MVFTVVVLFFLSYFWANYETCFHLLNREFKLFWTKNCFKSIVWRKNICHFLALELIFFRYKSFKKRKWFHHCGSNTHKISVHPTIVTLNMTRGEENILCCSSHSPLFIYSFLVIVRWMCQIYENELFFMHYTDFSSRCFVPCF